MYFLRVIFFLRIIRSLCKKNAIWIGAKNIFCPDFDKKKFPYNLDDPKKIRRKKLGKKKFQQLLALIGLWPLSSPVGERLHPAHAPDIGRFWIESH